MDAGSYTGTLSFRNYLQAELAARCAKNKRYSLRAFAKFLGVDHSTLSQMLRGKRAITPLMAERCGAKLGLDEEKRARLAIAPLRESPPVREDFIRVLTEWEHAAIVELTRLDCFQEDSRWIGRVLGVSADRVNIVLQRLMRLDLLRMERGGWRVRAKGFDLRRMNERDEWDNP